jgi:D-sedoheptulose 7-phosphate isomerase
MDNKTIMKELCNRYPQLISVESAIEEAAESLIKCYSSEGKLLVCGNGGSSSDSDHLVGELMKSFESKRPIKSSVAEKLTIVSPERGIFLAQKLEGGLPAISLSSQTALTTAVSNDMDASLIFAQQVLGYGISGDILVAISTSGNSQNIIDACITAKALNMKVIGLTGINGGRMKQYCDILINVPENRTAYIQELHLPVIHTLCAIIENHFFSQNQ